MWTRESPSQSLVGEQDLSSVIIRFEIEVATLDLPDPLGFRSHLRNLYGPPTPGRGRALLTQDLVELMFDANLKSVDNHAGQLTNYSN